VADRLSMGMERAVGLGVSPANRPPRVRSSGHQSQTPFLPQRLLSPGRKPEKKSTDPSDFPGDAGRARGRFAASTFPLQEDGTLRCPAGARLWRARTTAGDAVCATLGVLRTPARVPNLSPAGAVFGTGSPRQSCASGECRPPSAAPLPFPMSARRNALGNPLGGYGRREPSVDTG
jgi:hypothetical protein